MLVSKSFVALVVWIGALALVQAETATQSSSSRRWTPGSHPHRLRRQLQTVQTDIQNYRLWTSQEITETVTKWAGLYPNFIKVTTAQEAYGLPTAGGQSDCPFDNVQGCLNQILLLQDFEGHPEGSESSKRLPEVLWSGSVHGDERVGPTAALEAALLLMEAASCEALPRTALKAGSTTEEWQLELKNARTCRSDLAARGINALNRKWLARLLATRRILVVPTANALGYYQGIRTENGIDPNRDFNYDNPDVTQCMQTIAGRTLNEVYLEHMIQLSLTFHGGIEVISYEWGSPNWVGALSPDDTAQAEIAKAYSQFGGGWATSDPYSYGASNDVVYPVNGGMEDWAYAASWDLDRVVQCQPKTYGGYPAEKTTYDESTFRAFNILVETSTRKSPPRFTLGSTLGLMTNSSEGNGHVARNIRLSILSAELVEPYVAIRTINDLKLTDDVVPMAKRGGTACQATKAVAVPNNSLNVVVKWTVGGALTVDNTSLFFAKWDADLEAILDCQAQPDISLLQPKLSPATPIGATSGTTRFSEGASVFSASIDISGFKTGDKIAVVAVARVDQDWGTKLENVGPDVGPQAHIVKVRTDPNWRHEKPDGSKIIQGRLDWYSVPLTIVLTENVSGTAEELYIRYVESIGSESSSTPPSVSPPADSSFFALLKEFFPRLFN